MDDRRFRLFILKLNEYAAFVAVVLAVTILLGTTVLWWLVTSIDHRRAKLDHRQRITDQQLHDLACLGLKYTPDGSAFHRRLRVIFPDCPAFSPSPTPTRTVPGPTSTRTVVRPGPTKTAEALPQPTPNAPEPSADVRVVISAGPTVTRTRTLVRTVHPSSPKASPTQCRINALGIIVYCP